MIFPPRTTIITAVSMAATHLDTCSYFREHDFTKNMTDQRAESYVTSSLMSISKETFSNETISKETISKFGAESFSQ